jgi:hypothetical membrane protein
MRLRSGWRDSKRHAGRRAPNEPSVSGRAAGRRRLLREYGPGLAGLVGPPVFWTVLTILGQTQPAYNALRHDISLLALGPYGWTQSANFVIFGLSIIVFQRGLAEALVPGEARKPITVFLAFGSGLALVAMGIFPTDPPGTWTARGTVHLGIVATLAVLLPAICVATAGKLRRHPSWRGYAQFTMLVGVLTGILALMLLLVWIGAWQPLHPWIGLYERAAFVVPSVWMGVMGVRLMKKSPHCGPP